MLSWDSSRWGAQVAHRLGNCAQTGSVRKQQEQGVWGVGEQGALATNLERRSWSRKVMG